MLKYLLAAAVAFALVAAPAAPSFAQATHHHDTSHCEKDREEGRQEAPEKQSAQQQKMKDCGAKWGDYKKEKKVRAGPSTANS